MNNSNFQVPSGQTRQTRMKKSKRRYLKPPVTNNTFSTQKIRHNSLSTHITSLSNSLSTHITSLSNSLSTHITSISNPNSLFRSAYFSFQTLDPHIFTDKEHENLTSHLLSSLSHHLPQSSTTIVTRTPIIFGNWDLKILRRTNLSTWSNVTWI